MPRFTRPVSPVERVWLAMAGLEPPLAMTLVLEGRGDVDEGALRRAAEAITRAHPEIHAAPRGTLAWTKWVEEPGAIGVRVATEAAWDGTSSNGAGFLETPFDVDRGAGFEVVLVRGARGVTRVVLRGHAAVVDGRGLVMIAESLFDALSGRAPLPSNAALSDFEIGTSYPQRDLAPKALANLAPTGRADPRAPSSGHRWARVAVEGPTESTLARAIAAIAAHARSHEAGDVAIQVVRDLRALRPGARCASSLVGSITVDVAAGLAARDVERAIADGDASHEACAGFAKLASVKSVPLSAMQTFLASGTEKLFAAARFPASAILAHAGFCDLARMAGGGFEATDALFVPPGLHGVPLYVGIVETARGVQIAGSAPLRLATDARLEALLTAVRDALASGA